MDFITLIHYINTNRADIEEFPIFALFFCTKKTCVLAKISIKLTIKWWKVVDSVNQVVESGEKWNEMDFRDTKVVHIG